MTRDTLADAGPVDPPLPFSGGRFPASAAEAAQVERRIFALYLVAPLAATGVALAGFHFARPAWLALGAAGLGAVALAVGLLAALERRLMFFARSFMRRDARFVIYEGAAAVPFGLALASVGLCVLALVLAWMIGITPEQLREALLARPGLALVPIGLWFALTGLGLVTGFADRRGPVARRALHALNDLTTRLAGVLVAAIGLALLAAGLVDAMSPALFDAAFHSLAGNPWPWRSR
jgi:hypothetical protein